MSTLYTGFIILFIIVFFVSLIEYLTGAEREGLKFFIFFFIAFLLISFFLSLKSSKEIVQKFAEALAGLLQNFKEIK